MILKVQLVKVVPNANEPITRSKIEKEYDQLVKTAGVKLTSAKAKQNLAYDSETTWVVQKRRGKITLEDYTTETTSPKISVNLLTDNPETVARAALRLAYTKPVKV